MSSKKKRRSRSGIVKRAGGLLNTGEEHLEINYYHNGDINVQIPVYLSPDASVVGNITSPTVVIAGRILGAIAADAVVIDKGGQVWGDIYSLELHQQPGGKCFGWIISLDKGTIELLRSGAISREDLPAPGERSVPSELKQQYAIEGDELPMNPEQLRFIFRHLQSELAAAQLARIEIELAFDERIAEVFNQSKFRKQMEKEMRESVEAAQAIRDDGRVDESQVEESRNLTDAKIDQMRVQFDEEARNYKLKTATCLEQLAWYKVIKEANESELSQLRNDLTVSSQERESLRKALTDSLERETMPSQDEEQTDPATVNRLKAELTISQLRIDELNADLSYYRHLDRGSDK
jgi:cytoskeletal protein CcmA (bactofilin family)